MPAENVDLSTKFNAVASGCDKRFEELTGLRDVRDHARGLVESIFDQSIGARQAFVNEVGVQLVNRFRTGLEEAYAGSQLAVTYKLTHLSGVRAISIEV